LSADRYGVTGLLKSIILHVPPAHDYRCSCFDLMLTESLPATTLRFFLYSLAILVIMLSIPAFIQKGGIGAVKENGPIEWLQFGLLAGACLVFAGESLRNRPFRSLVCVMACLTAFAALRELDSVLLRLIPGLGYKVGFLFIIGAVTYACATAKTFMAQCERFVPTRAFAILWAGFMVAVPFAQLIGHGAFLQIVMGDDYNRDYKRLIEELGELMGYILLLIGSLEARVQLKHPRPGDPHHGAVSRPNTPYP
jgi:hypothetical protein